MANSVQSAASSANHRNFRFNAAIALVALLFVGVIGYFIKNNLQIISVNGAVAEAFYILLVVLALAAAIVLFGILQSTAALRGKHFAYYIELGGPAALFFAVILLGISQVGDKPKDFVLTVRFVPDSNDTIAHAFKEENVRKAKVQLAFNGYFFPGEVDSAGYVKTNTLEWKHRSDKVDIRLESDVFQIKDRSEFYLIPAISEPQIDLKVIPIPVARIVPDKPIEAAPIVPPKSRNLVINPKVSRITSGGTSDGHSPFCQTRFVQDCVTPQNGGKLVLGSGSLTNLRQSGRGGWTVEVNTPEQICVRLWASTGACETEVSIQGQVSAVEEN
ncbi:hypothetical protein [Bradyrhizobium cytisi]|uniref:Uncharacterized protein n=1 Tax=Bradyrhizobium cytisi TaxID=515489 RepID=A0A5S4WZZ0_9BRAD|nr:hypothetical protein [Bradyrhizobium cytisi]TYL86313.1 hypothetical protein FXB38_07475 [Bradyrhizobium cytisi]